LQKETDSPAGGSFNEKDNKYGISTGVVPTQ